ncbi:MAG: hypothetical protein ACOZIN_07285 [Myxococcota bacterium]
MQLMVKGMAKGPMLKSRTPPDADDFLSTLSTAMSWALLGSAAYSVLAALLFAWAVTLVAGFLPQQTKDVSTLE